MYFQNNVDSVTTKPRKQTACLMNLFILSIPVNIKISSLDNLLWQFAANSGQCKLNIHLLFINDSTLLLIRFRKCKSAALMVVGCELGTRNINI